MYVKCFVLFRQLVSNIMYYEYLMKKNFKDRFEEKYWIDRGHSKRPITIRLGSFFGKKDRIQFNPNSTAISF